jgi:hypothetical protein
METVETSIHFEYAMRSSSCAIASSSRTPSRSVFTFPAVSSPASHAWKPANETKAKAAHLIALTFISVLTFHHLTFIDIHFQPNEHVFIKTCGGFLSAVQSTITAVNLCCGSSTLSTYRCFEQGNKDGRGGAWRKTRF